MKGLKKFFRYFGVFVLLAAAVAGFKVANFLLGQKPEEELSEPSGKEESSALTAILDSIMNMSTGEFDISLTVDANGDICILTSLFGDAKGEVTLTYLFFTNDSNGDMTNHTVNVKLIIA